MPLFWGMQMGHKTRPGHANMQHQKMSCDWCLVFLEVFLTVLYFRISYSSHLQSLNSLPSGCGNGRHLHEWGISSEYGAVICHVNCITLDFIYFSSLGRTLSESWTTMHWGGCAPGVWTQNTPAPEHHRFCTRVISTGTSNFNKATKWISGTTSWLIHS